MEVLINAKQPESFELGDLIYVNNTINNTRLIVKDMDNYFALFNPKTCTITTNWNVTINALLDGMSPVLIKRANQIALTEVIK